MSSASSDGLTLSEFGVRFGERIVLAAVSFSSPRVGILNVLGPAGSGKSCLVRTLAGLNELQPSMVTWGAATMLGRPIGGAARPALVAQNSRLLIATLFENLASSIPGRSRLTRPEQQDLIAAELSALGLESLLDALSVDVVALPSPGQRLAAIARAVIGGAPVIALDEPTAGLDPAEARPILEVLGRIGGRRSIVVITHNQAHARALGGRALLLAGGRVIEHRAVEDFFSAPETPELEAFVRTGSCAVPGPNSRPEDLAEGVALPAPIEAPPSPVSLSSFRWLIEGRLGGLARPGLLGDLEAELTELASLGVSLLVTLEERETVDPIALARHRIESAWLPIDDMSVPTVAAAASLCRRIDAALLGGQVVALHCRAGLGRTGTMLASYLIWRGSSALEALEAARANNPRWVQSEEQVRFLAGLPVLFARDRGRMN